MSHEPALYQSDADERPTSHFVHNAMRFVSVVRFRWKVVLTSILVSGLLGGLYCLTTTRLFKAKAALLVIETGADQSAIGVIGDGSQRQLSAMPTYVNLLTYPKVLEGALRHLRPRDCVDMDGVARDKWVNVLRQNLVVKPVRGANFIEVSYFSRDREAAVQIIHAVVASYREFLNQTHRGAADEIADMLTTKMGELEGRIAETQQGVLQWRQKVGDIRLRENGRAVHPLVQRAASFNEELIAVQKQRDRLETSLKSIETAIQNGDDLQQHIMQVAEVVGKEMLLRSLGFNPRDTATQAALEGDLLEDRAELKTMQKHLAANHPDVIATEERISVKENYLLNYPQRVNEWLARVQNTRLRPILVTMVRQKLADVCQLESLTEQRYLQAHAEAAQLNAQLTQLENQERNLKRLQAWNERLLNKLTDLNIRQDGQEVRIEAVQDPQVASAPSVPNRRKVAMLSLLAGLVVGLLAVYILDTMDDRFRGIEDLQTQMRTTVLAILPRLNVAEGNGIDSLQVHVAPDTRESEGFRTLRTALALRDRQARHIVICSAEPGDGKTTVLANLGASYAQARRKTLLIDADLRRPALTGMMDMRGTEGLSTLLSQDGNIAAAAAAVIRASGIVGLDVLPSGPRFSNPAELLAQPRLADLLDWAESVYDQILIDSPPVLATSDAAVIGRLVDGVVLVVRPEKNCRRNVLRAAEIFSSLNTPLLGVAINQVTTESRAGYYGYGPGYAYDYTMHDESEIEPNDDIHAHDHLIEKIRRPAA